MTPVHLRKPPNRVFFMTGLFSEHRTLLRLVIIYTLLIASFIFALYRLKQFNSIPLNIVKWHEFWLDLNADNVSSMALGALAQFKTIVIVAITLFVVYNTLLRHVALSISRWRIDQSLAQAGNAAFLSHGGDAAVREQNELLDLIPKGDSSLTSYRAFQRLIQNTTLLTQDSPANIVESVRTTIEEEAQRNSSAQRLLLHLGILGTFIGLMLAVPSLTSILPDSATPAQSPSDLEITTGLSNLFKALAACFSTSIAGLVGSITVSSANNLLRRVHEKHLSALDDALLTLQAVVSENLFKRSGKTDFGSIWQALNQQNERLQSQTDLIQKGMGTLGDTMKLIETISKNISDTTTKMTDLQAVLTGPGLAATLGATVAESIKNGRDVLAEGTQNAAKAV